MAPANSRTRIAAIEYFRLYPSVVREEWRNGGHIWPTDLPCFLVKVTAEDGTYGIGEATSQPWYLGETAPQIASVLDLIRPRLIGQDASNISLCHQMTGNAYAGRLPGGRSARAGVDMAIIDLLGKQWGISASTLLGGTHRTNFELLVNLYDRSPAQMAEACQKAVSDGAAAIKVKVGDFLLLKGWSWSALIREAEVLEAALDVVPRAIRVDADANQSWESAQHTLALLRRFKDADNLSIEQPLGFADLSGAAYVRSQSGIPMILDESLWGPEAMAEMIRLNACDRVVVKVNRVGGMLPATDIIRMAEAARIGISLDTNPFTLVGDTASAHLAALTRFPFPIDCQGHRSFISFGTNDPFTGGVRIENGMAVLPDAPGLGVGIDWDRLHRHVEQAASKSG
jgi:muconate cycloisomerase